MVYDLSRSSAWAARFHRPRPIAHPAYTKEFNYWEACQPRADKRVKVTSAENQHKYKKKWLRSRFSMLFGVIDCIFSSLLKQLSPLLDLFKKSHLNSTEVMKTRLKFLRELLQLVWMTKIPSLMILSDFSEQHFQTLQVLISPWLVKDT